MLPNGLLSLHGYKVGQGYFFGQCRGTKFLPFELSCDQVKIYIAEAKAALESTEAFQARLRQPATEAKAFFYTRQASRKGRDYQASRTWQEVSVREDVVTYDGGQYSKFFREGDTEWVGPRAESKIEARETEVSAYSHGRTLLQICTEANEAYAKWLEHEADSLRRYITWQTERVTTWGPAELKPLVGPVKDDKQGFKPTEARY
jgi:hypothetical protein